MKLIIKISKILVGLLFIFSGFVKADDPVGFAIKLEEYFAKDALNLTWLNGFSLSLAIIIPIVEMVLGFMIIVGARKKITLWLLLLTILFFSFLTLYTAATGKVTECGCFGDAIPMTAWASFGKNMVLLFFIIILFLGSWHISPSFKQGTENMLVVLFTIASIGFSLYCYNYLPIIDFRPYKPGTDIKKAMQGVPDVLKYYYTLKNKASGKTEEFTKFPDNYQKDWDYVSNRTEVLKKGIEPKIKDFSIGTLDGNDITDSVLTATGYTFWLACPLLSESNKNPGTIKAINDLASECQKNHIGFMGLTSSDDNDIKSFVSQFNPPYRFYVTDNTQLRTMIRSNPGLILIHHGIVVADWHYHSIPDFNTVNQKYLQHP